MVACLRELHTPHPDMTYISNDPAWWSIISGALLLDYFVVASFAVVVYDWALTFGQEFELVWKQHWSLMTLLYVCVRYVGILFSIVRILGMRPQIYLFLLTDAMQRPSQSR